MKLCLSICLCVFLMVNCSALPVESRFENEARSSALTGSASSDKRSTRAVPIKFGKLAAVMGRKAIQLLLKDSKKIPTTAKYKLYEKSGSFQKAVEDFSQVNPVGQHEILTTLGMGREGDSLLVVEKYGPDRVGKVGRVGDRLLVMEKYGSETGKPTIDIVKIDSASKMGNKTGVSGKITVRIVYKD